ncbi:unnamed protein product [Psylliodes chrysocephalus]|uniref:Gustatory receptor n=1 Tax=Psylliodes chrysocephalus TaxID=3402493 RepID=A0A9P0G827_9CUCU|nr:unnamed protein product [Psylliodes chrysocephala]
MIYPAIIVVVYIGISAFDIYTRGQQDRSEIYHIIELVNVHSFSVTTILIMYFGIYYQRQSINLLEAINFFDKDIQKHKPISSIKLSNYNTKKHISIDDLLNDFEAIRRYYDKLHTITQQLNSIYSLRIMVQVYQILVSLITNVLFFVKQQSSANERKQSLAYILIIIEVMTMNIFQIISVCTYSMRLCDEAKRTPLILHEFPNSDVTDEYIVSEATSYLIICVQLDIPDMQVAKVTV